MAGISQQELATQAAVSRHSVLRLEQLCYPTPLPNVIDTLSDITGLSDEWLRVGYKADVNKNRFNSGMLFFGGSRGYEALQVAEAANNHVLRQDSVGPHLHVFEVWRRAIATKRNVPNSQIHFCQMFSVHPSVINRYEGLKTEFPKALEEAFVEATCPPELLDYFKTTPTFNVVVR